MDKYALVLGIAVAIVSIGFIIAHSNRNSKRERSEFERRFLDNQSPFIVPLPVVQKFTPVQDMFKGIKLTGAAVVENASGNMLLFDDYGSNSELGDNIAKAIVSATGIKIYDSKSVNDAFKAEVRLVQISGSEKKMIRPNFYIYPGDHIAWEGREMSVSNGVMLGIGLRGLYSTPTFESTMRCLVVVKLSRQELLDHLFKLKCIDGAEREWKLREDSVAFSKSISQQHGSSEDVYNPLLELAEWGGGYSLSAVDFGYSEEHKSHVIVYSALYTTQVVSNTQVCTWSIPGLSESILNAINVFTNNAFTLSLETSNRPNIYIYRANNFTNIQITKKDESGDESVFIFSDMASYFNQAAHFADDAGSGSLVGKLLALYPEIGKPTSEDTSTKKKEIVLDDNRKIVWYYNNTLKTE